MATNATIETLLNRRSIRKFKDEPIDDDTTATLETVAQHAASSQFLNDWSAIRVSDPAIKARLAEIGNQPYIATAPLLYVFVIDEHRNARIAQRKGIDPASDNSISSTAIASLRPRTTPCWLCTPWRPRPTR
ncbi:Chromate reductase/NADPH-dependent FMN reductase/Oxygen-insensitive NADPH nitroreductase [Bifidobacterium breve]|nr:Chromate reductase/NADPH-dependent FMN reductase/Oxygen-insensitive NADPH nitroreductase [Bifidobacterium breve]